MTVVYVLEALAAYHGVEYSFWYFVFTMTADETHEGEGPKAVKHAVQIVESHMPSAKEKAAIEIAMHAVDKCSQLMDIASHIKTHYDKAYPGSGKATEGVYHAMCGTHFASAR